MDGQASRSQKKNSFLSGSEFFLASARSAKTGRRALKFLLYYILQILSSKKLKNFVQIFIPKFVQLFSSRGLTLLTGYDIL